MSIEEVSKNTNKEKDRTKLLRKADLVKKGSIVITNNGSLSDFEAKLLEIVANL